uniref:DUF262 domain-containing protein n=1 Tax=viral metagenome TaxID=1070528 RepID=A0A6C0JZG7_9ZZZZ
MKSITRPISSLTRVHSYSDSHYISKCTIGDLLQANVANWEHNRPPDLLRCSEIAEHIYTRRPILDWMLYMTYDPHTNTFYVVDGIHQFTALQIIYKENQKPNDFITPNTFGCNGNADWLYQKYILICIRANPTKGETIDWFHTLNKSNPVPDLYIVNTAEEKRKLIEEVSQEWMRNFKPHFSASQKPNIPNINRDRFIDLLDGTYEKHCVKSVQYLNELLYELNNHIRENIPPKTSQNAIDKCTQSGCFLFLLPKDVLLERI